MVACYTTATVSDYTNLLIGNCASTTLHYGSWGLKSDADQKPLADGAYTACYAFDSVDAISQTDIEAMNAAIDTYNEGREATSADYCPYKWAWTGGNLPVLQ